MKRNTPYLTMLLGASMLSAGCAGAPTGPTAPALLAVNDCDRLAAEIARAGEARQAGLEKEKTAWKAVVPFAVATRYASGKSQAEKSEKQSEILRSDFERRGCESHGG